MSVYGTDAGVNNNHLTQNEVHLYGSSRLGIYKINRDVQNLALADYNNKINTLTRGYKFYELTNHLGNVLATVSDRKVMVLPENQGCSEGSALNKLDVYVRNGEAIYKARQEVNLLEGFESVPDDDFGVNTDESLTVCAEPDMTNPPAGSYYRADVVSAQDYYPFGMQMPGRIYQAGTASYRFGFGGQEKSDEIKGEGPSYTAQNWEYDPRIVRRWNVDPLEHKFPWQSPYATFDNNPISKVDPDGLSTKTTIVDKNNKVLTVNNDGKTDVVKLKNVDLNDWKDYLSNSENQAGADKVFTSLFKGQNAENIGNTITPDDFRRVQEKGGMGGTLVGARIDNNLSLSKEKLNEILQNSKAVNGKDFGNARNLIDFINSDYSKSIRSESSNIVLTLTNLAGLSRNDGPYDIKSTLLAPREGYLFGTQNGKNIYTTGRALGNILFGRNMLTAANASSVPNSIVWKIGMRVVGEYNHRQNGTPTNNEYYGEHPYSGSFIKYGFSNK